MTRRITRGSLARHILYCLRRRQPRDLDDLTRVYCRWRYGLSRVNPGGSIYRESRRSVEVSITILAVQGLVRVSGDIPPFDKIRVELTDKGREALKRHG